MKASKHRPTVARVDLDAIAFNVQQVSEHIPSQALKYAVVKANAYGHGVVAVTKKLAPQVDAFCVSNMDEALEIREEGLQHPILILGVVPSETVNLAKEHDIRLTVASLAWLDQLLGQEADLSGLKVHIKVDSGMGRIGFRRIEDIKVAERLLLAAGAEIEGIFTHFATADDFSQDDEYEKQLALFKSIVGNNRFKYIHCDNSAAMMFHHSDYGNLTRIGIAMYGVDPRGEENSDLKQAMSLYTKVAMVKVVPKGEKIGYGMTYTADEDQYIATLPIGYADGFTRANQGREVYINGHYYPVVGRVCMDQCMVKVDENVKPGDDVEIFGEHISLAKMAKEINTIPYEIICLISPRVERIYEK